MKGKKYCSAMRTGFAMTAVMLAMAFSATQAMAAATDSDDSDALLPAPVCVFGWSKDTCNGQLKGNVTSYQCRRIVGGQHVTCRTHHVRDAELRIPIRQSAGSCGTFVEVLCDQVPQLDGTIFLYGDFVFGHGDCPFRGAWEGRWRLVDTSGAVVADGIGSGTLGTGSHRTIGPCLLPFPYTCSIDCERCYDVSSVTFGGQTTWRVALEGALRGQVFAGEWASSEISITLSGTLNTPGTTTQPFDFGDWFYCGASDGTVLAKCQN